MTAEHPTPGPPAPPDPGVDATAGASSRSTVVAGVVLLIVFGLLAAGLLALALVGRTNPFGDTAAVPAPALELTDQNGQPFQLASLEGRPVLVFFGYTHCPDVCPATVGIVNEVLAATGDAPRAVFTSIDPERDDVAAMSSYLRYLPPQYVGLSGTPQQVRENADRWGVQYARIEQDSAAGYSMAHTADVFLVDAQGMIRTRFPFGTTAEPMIEAIRYLLDETPAPRTAAVTAAPSMAPAPATATPATPAPETATPEPASAPPAATASASAPPTGKLLLGVVSTSIWSGETDPVILRVVDSKGTRLDATTPVSVQLVASDGSPQGAPVTATAILPEGETQAYFIAPLTVPGPGAWRLAVSSGTARGEIGIQALDPGSTLPIGGPGPAIDTPTLADVDGVVRAVTTQPNPDLRMSQTSTADALAMGKPYVIVIDSARFKVSPVCGTALSMVRYLVDRWGDDVVFIHLEPFEYTIVTEEPVLSGSITDPPLNAYARAYGLGDATWPGVKMPWVFVVDGQGVVRAKYTNIIGSADIDVILSEITGRAAAGG
jgi:protein SCO1/2